MATTSNQLDAPQKLVNLTSEEGAQKVTLSFSLESYQRQYEVCLKQKAASSKFEGFRAGKAPLYMVESRYKDTLHQEALNTTIQATIYNYLEKKKPLLASSPKIVSLLKSNSDTKNQEFEVEFETFSSIKAKALAGSKFVIPTTQVPETFFDVLYKDFLYTRTTHYEPSDGPISPRDYITYSIALEDESLKDVAITVNQWLKKSHNHVIGDEKSLIGIFEPALIGMLSQGFEEICSKHLDFSKFLGLRKGNTFSTFLQCEQQKIPIVVKIEEIQKPIVSDLSRAEMKKLGCVDGDEKASLLLLLKEQCQLQISIFRRYKFKQAMLERLQNLYSELYIPKNFIEAALMHASEKLDSTDVHSILTKPTTALNELQQQLCVNATKKARPDVILGALSARYNVYVNDSEVEQLIQHSELAMKERGFSLNLHKNDKQAYVNLMRQYVLEEKITQILEPNTILVEPEISFEEFLDYAKTGTISEKILNSDVESQNSKRPDKDKQLLSTKKSSVILENNSSSKTSETALKKASKRAKISDKSQLSANESVKKIKKPRISKEKLTNISKT